MSTQQMIPACGDPDCNFCDLVPIARINHECKCSLRTKLVGDGCEVCNPKLAKEFGAQSRINPDSPPAK